MAAGRTKVAKLSSVKSAVSVLAVLVRLAAVVCLCVSMAGAQEFAWPPSTPDGEPRIDHTRKVLSCNGNRCELTMVRTQGELMQALIEMPRPPIAVGQEAAVVFRGNPGSPDAQQDDVSGRASGQVQQVQFSSGFHLILGGCFGGGLPATSIIGSEESARLQTEIEQRVRAPMARLRELQHENGRVFPRAVTPASAIMNVR
jgi:hypothetical protein